MGETITFSRYRLSPPAWSFPTPAARSRRSCRRSPAGTCSPWEPRPDKMGRLMRIFSGDISWEWWFENDGNDDLNMFEWLCFWYLINWYQVYEMFFYFMCFNGKRNEDDLHKSPQSELKSIGVFFECSSGLNRCCDPTPMCFTNC